MPTPEFTFTTEDAHRAALVGERLKIIAAPQALSAAEEYELEELALIITSDKPYAELTDDGRFYLKVFWALRAIEQGKTEIRKDIKDGVVPRDLTEFDELHDYVDANEYGGLCEMTPADRMEHFEWIAWGNAVQDALDTWIKDGRRDSRRDDLTEAYRHIAESRDA